MDQIEIFEPVGKAVNLSYVCNERPVKMSANINFICICEIFNTILYIKLAEYTNSERQSNLNRILFHIS